MYCVSLHWLFDSIEKGFCQDESRYIVQCNAAKSTRPHTSTPTGTNKKEGTPQCICSLSSAMTLSLSYFDLMVLI